MYISSWYAFLCIFILTFIYFYTKCVIVYIKYFWWRFFLKHFVFIPNIFNCVPFCVLYNPHWTRNFCLIFSYFTAVFLQIVTNLGNVYFLFGDIFANEGVRNINIHLLHYFISSFKFIIEGRNVSVIVYIMVLIHACRMAGWPSGLRRWFKAPVSSEARVRISLLSNFQDFFIFLIAC